MDRKIFTQELVKQLFIYREDGTLEWNPETSGFEGEVGVIGQSGYRRAHILGNECAIHRLVFLFHNGYLPEHPNSIDHINRIKTDNRIENLREATPSMQSLNTDRPIIKKKTLKVTVEWSEEELDELGPLLRTAVDALRRQGKAQAARRVHGTGGGSDKTAPCAALIRVRGVFGAGGYIWVNIRKSRKERKRIVGFRVKELELSERNFGFKIFGVEMVKIAYGAPIFLHHTPYPPGAGARGVTTCHSLRAITQRAI